MPISVPEHCRCGIDSPALSPLIGSPALHSRAVQRDQSVNHRLLVPRRYRLRHTIISANGTERARPGRRVNSLPREVSFSPGSLARSPCLPPSSINLAQNAITVQSAPVGCVIGVVQRTGSAPFMRFPSDERLPTVPSFLPRRPLPLCLLSSHQPMLRPLPGFINRSGTTFSREKRRTQCPAAARKIICSTAATHINVTFE